MCAAFFQHVFAVVDASMSDDVCHKAPVPVDVRCAQCDGLVQEKSLAYVASLYTIVLSKFRAVYSCNSDANSGRRTIRVAVRTREGIAVGHFRDVGMLNNLRVLRNGFISAARWGLRRRFLSGVLLLCLDL